MSICILRLGCNFSLVKDTKLKKGKKERMRLTFRTPNSGDERTFCKLAEASIHTPDFEARQLCDQRRRDDFVILRARLDLIEHARFLKKRVFLGAIAEGWAYGS
jgi:hypothetical protein